MTAILLALATPAAATAQEQAAAVPAAPDQSGEERDPEIVVEGEKPKRVCESRRETGSIIPRRVCRTPEQVAAEEERARLVKDGLSRDREAAQHTAASRGNR